jgi:hypothetical protein
MSTIDNFMNPDAIIALTTEVLGSSKPKNSLRHNFQHSLHMHVPRVNKQTEVVLDSIAGICISEASSSVVAVVLKLSLPTILFIVASNDENKNPSIAEHLTKVWNLLKGISDLIISDLNREDIDMTLETPKRRSNSDAEESLADDFYSYVYVYSRAVVLKRLNKHEKNLPS